MLQSSHPALILVANEPKSAFEVGLQVRAKSSHCSALAVWEPNTKYWSLSLEETVLISPADSLSTYYSRQHCLDTAVLFLFLNSVRHLAGNSPCSNVCLIKNLTTSYNLIVKWTFPPPANEVSMETADGAVATKWRGFINGSFNFSGFTKQL